MRVVCVKKHGLSGSGCGALSGCGGASEGAPEPKSPPGALPHTIEVSER